MFAPFLSSMNPTDLQFSLCLLYLYPADPCVHRQHSMLYPTPSLNLVTKAQKRQKLQAQACKYRIKKPTVKD